MTTTGDFAPPDSATNPRPLPPKRGRPETHDKITLMAVRGNKRRKNVIRLTFSRNIIDGLLEYYDRMWHEGPFWKKHEYRYDFLRFQVAPFHKLMMGGAFVRIHPTPFAKAEDGKGIKVHRKGNKFFFQIVGRKMGFRNNIKTKDLEFAWAPYGFGGHGGLVLWFDDDDMRYPTVAQVKKLPRDYSFVIGAPQRVKP